MEVDAYGLWQLWQQMHYPRRGLPESGDGTADLLAVDGTAGVALDRHFRRGRRSRPLDRDSRVALEACRRRLDELGDDLGDDAARYFGRLRQLVEIVLASAAHGDSGVPDDSVESVAHSATAAEMSRSGWRDGER